MTAPLLTAPPVEAAGGIRLDPSQRAVAMLPGGASAVVLGAPGSGKTTTLVELTAARLDAGLRPDEIVVLAPGRAAATALRDRLAARWDRTLAGPAARTPASFAFTVVRRAAAAAGEPAPGLLTGGEHDAVLRELLEGTAVAWPDRLTPEVVATRRFRSELRELLMRATEHGVDPVRLRSLAAGADRPEWAAVADFAEEYYAVVASASTTRLDPAELMAFATAAVRGGDPDPVLDAVRLVVLDDAQEATRATLDLVRALAARGAAVVALGDPDVAGNAFRGGDPAAVGALAAELGAPVLSLSTVHRHGGPVRALVSRVVQRIGTAGVDPARRRATGAVDSAGGADGPGGAAWTDAVDGPGGGPDAVGGPDGEPDGTGGSGAMRSPSVAGPVALSAQAVSDASRTGAAASTAADTAAVGGVAILQASTPARQWAAVARVLRERHLRDGVPWSRLAVLVRGNTSIPAAVRALGIAEVPTRTTVGSRALRDDRAARALVAVVDVAIGRRPLDREAARELLLSPFGGLDEVGLRRLRAALRTADAVGAAVGGERIGSADLLLVDALADPAALAAVDSRESRAAARLATLLAAVTAAARDAASIEELLWLAWDGSGLARRWRSDALGTGVAAAEANRALDAVLAVFAAAKRFVERRPGDPAALFLEQILGADITDDALLPPQDLDAVLVATPAAVVGAGFDTVVVGDLQDGVWPNPTLRGSLLGSEQLVRRLRGDGAAAIDARREVLDDELRLFALAVSRAHAQVVLACVANDDESPSVLLSLAPDGAPRIDGNRARPYTLRGVTAALRRDAVSGPPPARAAAARGLARLAAEGLPGADPDTWHGLAEVSTDAPLHTGDEDVRLSPSKLAALEENPLHWFIDRIASQPPAPQLAFGRVIHSALETAEPNAESLWAAVEARWHELEFDAEWVGRQQRETARAMTDALADYLRDRAAAGATLVSAEGGFEVRVGRAVLTGAIDRVEQGADGAVVIVDLKTGSTVASKAETAAHAQLSSYQLAYALGSITGLAEPHSNGGATLLYVRKGANGRRYTPRDQAPLDAEGMAAFRARVDAAVDVVASARFDGQVDLDEFAPGNARFAWHTVRAVCSD